MKSYLLVPRLRIQNANAASSPYTVGFPAMTAWLGMVHALQRLIQKQKPLHQVCLPRAAVVCHACEMQSFKDVKNYYSALIGTANPLKKSKKTGEFERPAFIEEARCHLTVSLLMEVEGLQGTEAALFEETARRELPRLKAAGGDITADAEDSRHWKLVYAEEFEEKEERRILARLMPGYAIIQRGDLLAHDEGTDTLDKLLDILKVRYRTIQTASEEGQAIGKKERKLLWQREKVVPAGWLVPIAVGFRDLSGSLKVAEQRSYDYEHHFVEPLVTAGEFVMPYRVSSIKKLMWEYHYDEQEGLYMCQNNGLERED